MSDVLCPINYSLTIKPPRVKMLTWLLFNVIYVSYSVCFHYVHYVLFMLIILKKAMPTFSHVVKVNDRLNHIFNTNHIEHRSNGDPEGCGTRQ